ncbi:MAG: 50S ribosomal protein L29 [bacterium]|nr:50S ribosomal protein L29 [bacterium]
MKAHEMREMTEIELQSHQDELVEEMANLRIKNAVKQLDNPLRLRGLRKEIARAKTILKDKQLGEKPGEKLEQKD